jgi:hypothetical protein
MTFLLCSGRRKFIDLIQIPIVSSNIAALESAVAPSYGVGLKISLTETFGIKLSYDAWETPISGDAKTNDSAIRAGITWVL